jgi:hypothetical protein
VFILWDEMRTFMADRVKKCNEAKLKTYFKAFTATQNKEMHNFVN